MRRITGLVSVLGLALVLAACQQSTPAQPAAQGGDDGGVDVGTSSGPLASSSPVDPDPNNPLIGQWILDGGLACNYDHATFTDDVRVLHRTADGERAGRDIPSPVADYKVERGKVAVEIVGEDDVASYVIFDPDHMDDGTDNCRFHRQK